MTAGHARALEQALNAWRMRKRGLHEGSRFQFHDVACEATQPQSSHTKRLRKPSPYSRTSHVIVAMWNMSRWHVGQSGLGYSPIGDPPTSPTTSGVSWT